MLLTVKEAAAALKVSPNFVYKLIGSRLLRHERHGRSRRAAIRITQESLDEYRRARTVEAGEATTPSPPPRRKNAEASVLRRKHLDD